MPRDVSDAFVAQYESEVHLAYQRQGSLLRQTVRQATGIVGSTDTFQKMGTGQATQKSRHGLVTPMNPDHTSVSVTLQDYYAGDYVDKLDLLKIRHDERTALVNTGAYALGRKTDDLILAALGTATNDTGSATRPGTTPGPEMMNGTRTSSS